MMRRLKTVHSYHDAEIRSVSFEHNASVVFEVVLCGCSEAPGATVHLTFHRVRNIDAVREFVVGLRAASGRRQGRFAEIVGFVRDHDRRFLLDLDSGPLYVDAGGFTET